MKEKIETFQKFLSTVSQQYYSDKLSGLDDQALFSLYMELSFLVEAIADRHPPFTFMAKLIDVPNCRFLSHNEAKIRLEKELLTNIWRLIREKCLDINTLDTQDEITQYNLGLLFYFTEHVQFSGAPRRSRSFMDVLGSQEGLSESQCNYSFDITTDEFLEHKEVLLRIVKDPTLLSLISEGSINFRALLKDMRLVDYINENAKQALHEKLISIEALLYAEGYSLEVLFIDRGLEALRMGFVFDPKVFHYKMKCPANVLMDAIEKFYWPHKMYQDELVSQKEMEFLLTTHLDKKTYEALKSGFTIDLERYRTPDNFLHVDVRRFLTIQEGLKRGISLHLIENVDDWYLDELCTDEGARALKEGFVFDKTKYRYVPELTRDIKNFLADRALPFGDNSATTPPDSFFHPETLATPDANRGCRINQAS